MRDRKLVIKSSQEALSVMTAMLAANMIDNELVAVAVEKNVLGEEILGTHKYNVRLGWLNRGDDDLVGCPCFACDFDGILPTGECIQAVVYVKAFANRTLNMCRMHRRDEVAEFKEIKDGETFVMHDELERFEDESYRYLNGEIIKC